MGKAEMIDVHTHLGEVVYGDPTRKGLTPHQLVDTMNRLGIDKSVLLPLDSPEASDSYFTVESALEAQSIFPERLIVFCCVDPRRARVAQRIEKYKNLGCVGFGEHKVGLPIDHQLSMKIYEVCGELGLPVLLHMDHMILPRLNWDEAGLPNTRKVVETFPNTNFIMHGPGWWSEISTTVEAGVAYPKGPIGEPGAAAMLLDEYPNVYADLSAGSAYNALTRDPEFAKEFLDVLYHKLIFGTDYLHSGQKLPIVDFVNSLDMEEEKVNLIKSGNIKRLIGKS